MYNFEYYGFSLLCYIQRECNFYFQRERGQVETIPSFLSDNSTEVQRVLNYELRSITDSTASGRPAEGKYIDYSRPEEVLELDLVHKWFDGVLDDKEIEHLSDACYELGLAGILWQVSQWTPDRRRRSLVMIDTTGPMWSRGRIIAASIASGENKSKGESEKIRVTSRQMEDLCVRFNKIRLADSN